MIGSSKETLEIVRKYHSAWVNKNFEEAIQLLSPQLVVEVPVNSYPTKESFAEAVRAFGSLAKTVRILGEFANEDQAVILYDMDVEGLGQVRMAENFFVKSGLINKIRQIHDTHEIRKAGFARS